MMPIADAVVAVVRGRHSGRLPDLAAAAPLLLCCRRRPSCMFVLRVCARRQGAGVFVALTLAVERGGRRRGGAMQQWLAAAVQSGSVGGGRRGRADVLVVYALRGHKWCGLLGWQRGSASELAANWMDTAGRCRNSRLQFVCFHAAAAAASGGGGGVASVCLKRAVPAGGRVASCVCVRACDKCSAVVVAAGMKWHEVAPWPTGQLLLIRLFQL